MLGRGQSDDRSGNGGDDLRGVRDGFLGEPGLATKHLGHFARHQSTNTRICISDLRYHRDHSFPVHIGRCAYIVQIVRYIRNVRTAIC